MKRKIFALFLLLIVFTALISFASAEEANRTIKFEQETYSVFLGKQLRIVASVENLLESAPKKTTLIWSSSDPSVVSVSSNGTIRGVSSGKAIITVSAKDDEHISASVEVEVQIPVAKISVDTKKVVMPPEENWKVVAAIEPESATNKELVWSSSNEAVATVSQEGIISAKNKGKCTVAVSSTDGSKKIIQISVEVKDFDVVISQRGATRVGFTTQESSGWTSIVSNRGMYQGKFSITVKISNGCVQTTQNDGELSPVKPGIDTVIVTKKYGKATKEKYSIFVSQDAFGPPKIEDFGFGKGAIVSAGYEGVFNDHLYKVFYDRYRWEDAKKACEELGGHLVTITTSEEQKFLEMLNSQRKVFWIGYERVSDDSENWQWITSEAIDYTNWNDGEPNNYNGSESKASLRPDRWNDLNEDSTGEIEGYICEWDEIPEGTY